MQDVKLDSDVRICIKSTSSKVTNELTVTYPVINIEINNIISIKSRNDNLKCLYLPLIL